MRTALEIAWRYLFAKKSHNAINIVSGISATGVGVVTAALVCVLSVMNGFGRLIEGMFSAFDPELRITATSGKVFTTDTDVFDQIRERQDIAVFSETLEETALLKYGEKQVPAIVKGVDDKFEQLTNIDDLIIDGEYRVVDLYEDDRGVVTRAFERCVLGAGLAQQVGIRARYVSGLQLYAPKRVGKINMLRPDKSLNDAGAFIAGVFAVNQSAYDDSYILVSLPMARELFEYDEAEVSAVELRLQEGANVKKVKRELSKMLGSGFQVQDRYEQQADFYRIMRIEKILTTLLLAFILLIASFNIISSLSLLIIDKKEDIKILHTLGADGRMVQQIFLLEGWLISTLGAVCGLIGGVLLCLGQEKFGWLKLGTGGDYIISAYPVAVQATDLLVVLVLVLLLGFVAAYIPTKQLRNEK